jgi:uncharacterized protein (DUF3084 family)
MTEDISAQVLSQTSNSIQKLFELSTRIDERVKNIQTKQGEVDEKLEELMNLNNHFVQRLIVVEQRNGNAVKLKIEEMVKDLIEFDKRLAAIEQTSKKQENRWNGAFDFFFKMIWIVLTAWILYKLNLQPPLTP